MLATHGELGFFEQPGVHEKQVQRMLQVIDCWLSELLQLPHSMLHYV